MAHRLNRQIIKFLHVLWSSRYTLLVVNVSMWARLVCYESLIVAANVLHLTLLYHPHISWGHKGMVHNKFSMKVFILDHLKQTSISQLLYIGYNFHPGWLCMCRGWKFSCVLWRFLAHFRERKKYNLLLCWGELWFVSID